MCVNFTAKASEAVAPAVDIKPLMSIDVMPSTAVTSAAVTEPASDSSVKQEVSTVNPAETVAAVVSEPQQLPPPSQTSSVAASSSSSTPAHSAAPTDFPFPGAPPPPPPPFSGFPPFLPGMPPHLANIPLPAHPPPAPPAPHGGPPRMQNPPPFPSGGPPPRPPGPGLQQGGPMPPQNMQSGFSGPPSSMHSGPPQFGQFGPRPPGPGMPFGQVRPLLPGGPPGMQEFVPPVGSESAEYDPEQPIDDDEEDSRYDQFDREIQRDQEPRYGQEYEEPYGYESGGEGDYYDEGRRGGGRGSDFNNRQGSNRQYNQWSEYTDCGRRRSPTPPRRGRESSRRRSRSRERRRSQSHERNRRRSRSRSSSPSTGYRGRQSRSPDRRDRHPSPPPLDTWQRPEPSFGRTDMPGQGKILLLLVYNLSWLGGSVVERWSLTGELSLVCT